MVVAIVVLIVAALVYEELYSSPAITTKLACTDFGCAAYASKATNGSTLAETTTVSTSYTATAISSAPVGQTTAVDKALLLPPVRLPNGSIIISVSSSHSCIYTG